MKDDDNGVFDTHTTLVLPLVQDNAQEWGHNFPNKGCPAGECPQAPTRCKAQDKHYDKCRQNFSHPSISVVYTIIHIYLFIYFWWFYYFLPWLMAIENFQNHFSFIFYFLFRFLTKLFH
jgi:hypothetical protein